MPVQLQFVSLTDRPCNPLEQVQAKLGEPPSDYLHLMAEGCHLACLQNDGLIEPLYRLHASRLKLIIQKCPVPDGDLEPCWTAATRHCFLPATSDAIKDTCVDPIVGLRLLLLQDCAAAMSWIVDKDKNYHKASEERGRIIGLAKTVSRSGLSPFSSSRMHSIHFVAGPCLKGFVRRVEEARGRLSR